MVSDTYIGENTDLLLGQEFLTWLWHKSETMNGQFRNTHGEAFHVSMEQRVVVRGGEGDAKETASVSGPMSLLREARLGVTMGKKVVRALVRLEKDGLDWQVNLRAEDFSLSSFKTPPVAKPEKDDDPDAAFLEKMYLMETGLAMLDTMYAQFLEARLTSATWNQELKAVAAWLKETGV